MGNPIMITMAIPVVNKLKVFMKCIGINKYYHNKVTINAQIAAL